MIPKKIFSRHHYATLKLAHPLGACDIGIAKLDDGSGVFITWGRNMDIEEAAEASRWTALDVVETEKDKFELILPEDQVKQYESAGLFIFHNKK